MSELARRRVMLIFGGRSAEHDVSRVTAVAVAKALDPQKFEVLPVAITREGEWLLADAARELIARDPRALPAALDVEGSSLEALGEVVARPGSGGLGVDVVFPLLHGPYGEDGTIQGVLDLADLPYVGSGVLGSAVGMDKIAMKRAFAACGVPQGEYRFLRDGQDRDAFAASVVAELGLPCFVKPANMGSSVGVRKAKDRDELVAAIDHALDYDEWILAEEAVTGREIEVAVLGDAPPEASLPGEIIPGDEFYTYADKYEDGVAQLLTPAPLDDAATAEVRALAVRAFEACRLDAMARVDFFYEEGGRGFLVNEVNTIPGFTPISMFPKLWEVSGLPYAQLLERLIELAIERHDRRAKRAGRQRD
jgi:D-alanine-D-alanine ligase